MSFTETFGTFFCLLQKESTEKKRDPFKRNFPEEIKPDYELIGGGLINEGEVIFPQPVPTLTGLLPHPLL